MHPAHRPRGTSRQPATCAKAAAARAVAGLREPAATEEQRIFGAAGMRRLAGRTRIARKWLVMAAVGLPWVALVPCRQVTGWVWSALARASWRKLTGAVR